ncbi:exosortase family protein XrtF [Nonlabens xiamenensis]|uniref:exosortase family protein XrtF n=1 Tax=Nonlabens xiamenensis TaxID=2341043 RepID=UPI000F605C8B|nr:exosortase family protein XrtF [Nonlabens xiamenensis]
MKSLRPYFPIFKFVAVFAGIYLLLSLLYYFYLQQDWNAYHFPDPVTAQISHQTKLGLEVFGYEVRAINTPDLPSVTIFMDEQAVFRVIEGCNAVSVMILFVSFVLAFAKAWQKTLLFLLIGIGLIYLVNLVRLVLLGMIYKEYPLYAHQAHELAFPAVIYGSVILLWIYWIKKPKVDET